MPKRDLASELNSELDDSLTLGFAVGSVSASIAVAVLSYADRFVNVFENDGIYVLSFHWNGRQQAHGKTSDLSSAADSARLWVEGGSLENVAAVHPFVEFSGLQLAYEQGRAVEFRWAELLALVKEEEHAFRDLVVLASRDEFLQQLFPHLGHRFALSADEYCDDILVAVFVYRPGWFVIFRDGDGDLEVEFEGDAHQMVGYLADRLRGQASS